MPHGSPPRQEDVRFFSVCRRREVGLDSSFSLPPYPKRGSQIFVFIFFSSCFLGECLCSWHSFFLFCCPYAFARSTTDASGLNLRRKRKRPIIRTSQPVLPLRSCFVVAFSIVATPGGGSRKAFSSDEGFLFFISVPILHETLAWKKRHYIYKPANELGRYIIKFIFFFFFCLILVNNDEYHY